MQKTKKFRRLLAGGVAVLMLGVSVPVAAFATDGDEPGPGYRFVDITFNTFNEDVTFVENGETTLTVTTTDDQTAYAIPAVNCENGYEVTGWSTSYGATVTDTVDASQAYWDESNYWGTGTMSVTANIEKVGPVVENKDVVVYFTTDDGETLLEQPVNVPVTSDGGVETVALADLESALADYLAQKGYALAEGNNDPQTVTDGSVNLMVNKVSGPVVENKDVVVYFTTDDGETLVEYPVNVPVTSDGGDETVALADLENALADYLAQKGYALAEGNNDPQTVTNGSVNLMVNKISNTQKSVEITFAIDDTNNHGTFAAGQTYLNWSWTDMNETITSAPEVICDEGYKLVGWRVQGDTTTYLSADAFGIDPYLAYFGDNDENEVGYMTIYPVFDKVEAPAKSVEVTFAIDTNDAHGTFVNGQTYLNWKWDDMNETITSQPEVICDEGYKLVGWRIQGDTTSYLSVEGFGVDPYLAYFGENDENSVGYMTIYPVFEAIETPAPAKSVEISFAIDSTDAHGTFVNGQTYLNWKWDDMNEIITSQPEVICDEGYELVGWRIQGDTTTFLTVEGYGIDPYLAYFGENDENTVGYMTVYPVFAKIDTDVIMNIQFWDNDTGEVVAGGDYFVPMDEDGIQNYSILQQYVPEGYEMLTGGDFFVVEGGHLDVTVQKIQKNVPMTIRFVLVDGTVVSSDEYSLPEGIQNMSILEQYVPAGYKMMESGDFFVTEGGQEDITVEKINETVTVSVAFKNEWGFVVGGGYYIVPAGEQDVSVLAQYVPAGYVLDEEGTINFVDGQHYDISVKSDESIVNIQFIDREGNVIAGGDYFVPTGVQNTAILDELGYTPVGYRQVVHTYVLFMYGHHYVILVEAIPEQVTAKTAVFRKDAAEDVWNENPDNPDEVRYTFYSDDAEATNTVPSITVADETKELDYWVAEMDSSITLQPGEEFCYNDLDQGALKDQIGDLLFIAVYKDVEVVEPTPAPSEEPTPAPSEEPTPAPSEEPTPAPSEEPTPAPSEQPTAEPTAAPTAQPETPADNNDDNTTTVTSDNSDDVVKSDTPADNTAKVLPQTGVESSAPVIGFAFVLLAALGGAAAYLFVVRKKLN